MKDDFDCWPNTVCGYKLINRPKKLKMQCITGYSIHGDIIEISSIYSGESVPVIFEGEIISHLKPVTKKGLDVYFIEDGVAIFKYRETYSKKIIPAQEIWEKE